MGDISPAAPIGAPVVGDTRVGNSDKRSAVVLLTSPPPPGLSDLEGVLLVAGVLYQQSISPISSIKRRYDLTFPIEVKGIFNRVCLFDGLSWL